MIRCSIHLYYELSKNESPIFIKPAKLFIYQNLLALSGGDNRDRTGNLQLAKLALSQLSYVP